MQAREHIRQQRKKHEDQVDEWLKEIDDLKQRLDMALAGVSQTVDPSSWKMQIKTLHQSIRRLKEQQANLHAKKLKAKSELNTLRENMMIEGSIAREAAKLARRTRTLERLLKAKSSSVKKLRVRQHSNTYTNVNTNTCIYTTHQKNLTAVKRKKSQPKNKSILENLKSRCIYFEELSDKLQEELHDAQHELKHNHQPVPRSLAKLKSRGKRKPFPLRFVLLCMELLGNGSMASRVSQNIASVLRFAGHPLSDNQLPHETTLRKWRFSMAHICMKQVGHALTQAARNAERNLTMCSDGSPVKGFHVEGCIVTVNGKSLSLIPRVVGSKAATETSNVIITSMDECQGIYNNIYVATMKRRQLMRITEPPPVPKPVPLGSLLLLFTGVVNDHAPNEKAKANCILEEKEIRLVEHCTEWADFGFTSKEEFERYASSALYVFFCSSSNHKNMLLSSVIREADHNCLLDSVDGLLPPQRDRDEFRTSNVIDMAQLQLSKMFNHTKRPYAFGHGVLKFPAWMAKKYHNFNRWVGLKRLVGNRAQIFLENALCMYHMATYYQVCLGSGFEVQMLTHIHTYIHVYMHHIYRHRNISTTSLKRPKLTTPFIAELTKNFGTNT